MSRKKPSLAIDLQPDGRPARPFVQELSNERDKEFPFTARHGGHGEIRAYTSVQVTLRSNSNVSIR